MVSLAKSVGLEYATEDNAARASLIEHIERVTYNSPIGGGDYSLTRVITKNLARNNLGALHVLWWHSARA